MRSHQFCGLCPVINISCGLAQAKFIYLTEFQMKIIISIIPINYYEKIKII
jgi:hypothetical protein